MSRYVGRPIWLSDDFELCALYVMDEILGNFSGIQKPKNLVWKGYDPQLEPNLKRNLANASQFELNDIHHTEIYCMSSDAFIYFLPSLARLALTVDDFNSYTPAEDGSFDDAVMDKCKFSFDDMTIKQQAACKCLVAILLSKSSPAESFECDLVKWKHSPPEMFWAMLEPNL